MLRGATLWHIWCARYRLDSYSESMNWEEMCHKVETSYHDNDLILILLISPQVVGSEREVARNVTWTILVTEDGNFRI